MSVLRRRIDAGGGGNAAVRGGECRGRAGEAEPRPALLLRLGHLDDRSRRQALVGRHGASHRRPEERPESAGPGFGDADAAAAARGRRLPDLRDRRAHLRDLRGRRPELCAD